MIGRRSLIAVAVALTGSAIVGGLSGCGKEEAAQQGGKTLIPIGIVQLVEHEALDAANRGIVDALAERGYKEGVNVTIDRQNAQADQSNLQNIAARFVSNDSKILFAIATPAAQTLAAATKTIPIVATAVTNFEVAKLVASNEKPGGNVTGVEKDLALDFLQFLYTDESLCEFTQYTSAPKALNYDVKGVEGLSYFAQSVFDMKNRADIVYPYSSAPIYADQPSSFEPTSFYQTTVHQGAGNVPYTYTSRAMYDDGVTALQYFNGLSVSRSESAWKSAYEKYYVS